MGGVNIIVVLKYVPGHHCGEPLEGIPSLNKYLLSDGSMLGAVQSLRSTLCRAYCRYTYFHGSDDYNGQKIEWAASEGIDHRLDGHVSEVIMSHKTPSRASSPKFL